MVKRKSGTCVPCKLGDCSLCPGGWYEEGDEKVFFRCDCSACSEAATSDTSRKRLGGVLAFMAECMKLDEECPLGPLHPDANAHVLIDGGKRVQCLPLAEAEQDVNAGRTVFSSTQERIRGLLREKEASTPRE